MTKQEVHELLVDYIDYHAKEKKINDDQYFKMKATARIYAKGHLEKVESSSRISQQREPLEAFSKWLSYQDFTDDSMNPEDWVSVFLASNGD